MSIVKIDATKITDLDYSLPRETIQCNRLGAYTISSLIDCNTRKYHGLLVAPQPQIDQDQHVFVSTIHEELIIEEEVYSLATQKYPSIYAPMGHRFINSIEVDPVQKISYGVQGVILSKQKLLLSDENKVLIQYTLVESQSEITLRLKPFLAFRNKHTLCRANDYINNLSWQVDKGVGFKLYPIYDDLFLQLSPGNHCFHEEACWYYRIEYDLERERGYDYQEDLWVPGYFEVTLAKGESIIFSAGLTESIPNELKGIFGSEIKKAKPRDCLKDYLNAAADQFIIHQGNKTEIIAGYPWFGRWGRDTFIALPGLTLARGDADTCRAGIRTMINELSGPLFPNNGSGENAALNTVDAPLWFFWTLQQYAHYTDSLDLIWEYYGKEMRAILEGYRYGTSFNIKMLDNGLIYAGEEGKALTWMDAVYQGKAYTPRIGSPVEINALWYNAVYFSLVTAKLAQDQSFVNHWKPLVNLIKQTFISNFWDSEKGYLADCINEQKKDWSIRPNQIFATSLPYILVDNKRAQSILEVVKKELLTNRGLRSLSPKDKQYIGIYFGDQETRDRAYHQGTVWPWLLGHFVEGYLRTFGSDGINLVKSILQGFKDTISEHGIGTISEIYDGDPPHRARGAISQAWSVAELLRISLLIDQFEGHRKPSIGEMTKVIID